MAIIKKCIIILIIMILSVSLLSCNNKQNKQNSSDVEVVETTVEEPEKLIFEVDQNEMCNLMQEDNVFIEQNKWFYGFYDTWVQWGLAMFRIDDQKDVTWIKEEHIPENFVIKDEYVYFTLRANDSTEQYENKSTELYRCKLGGTKLKKLQGSSIHCFRIYNNKIYYTKGGEKSTQDNPKNTLYRCNLNGKKKKIVLDRTILNPYFVDDKIFYIDPSDKERLHMYDMNTKEDQRITKKVCSQYVFDGEDILYLGAKKKKEDNNEVRIQHLIKHNINTGEEKILHKYVRTFNVYKDTILFVDYKDDFQLYSINKQGDDIQLVVNEKNIDNVSIFNNNMYLITYYLEDGDQIFDKMYRCKIDGSKKKEVVNYYKG